jgi:hypothetical protein
LVLPFLVYSTKFSYILMIDVWADLFAQMDSDRPVWCADVQHHLPHINFGVKEILWVAGTPFTYILKCSLDSVLRYSSGISFVLKHHCSLRHINQRSYTLCYHIWIAQRCTKFFNLEYKILINSFSLDWICSLGPPDFYPPTSNCAEEILNRESCQSGYKELIEGIEVLCPLICFTVMHFLSWPC